MSLNRPLVAEFSTYVHQVLLTSRLAHPNKWPHPGKWRQLRSRILPSHLHEEHRVARLLPWISQYSDSIVPNRHANSQTPRSRSIGSDSRYSQQTLCPKIRKSTAVRLLQQELPSFTRFTTPIASMSWETAFEVFCA
jgi:hypothetical protein